MINNDTKILDLKKKIADKKEEIKNKKRYHYMTNCILELDGKKYNIHVLSKEELMLLGAKIDIYNKSAENLFKEKLVIRGFSCDCWLEDIKARYNQLSLAQEEKELDLMEEKLTALLSRDKKVELEINSIEEALGLL